MSIAPNFSIVTLGVADLAVSAGFYRRLGWPQHGDESAGITWFRTSGTWIGLYGHEALAEDVGLTPGPTAPGPTAPGPTAPAFRGVTLALNFASTGEVDAALAVAVDAGAGVVKEPVRADWGGYSGYFSDPDGHLWELAYAPMMPAREDGTIEIPE